MTPRIRSAATRSGVPFIGLLCLLAGCADGHERGAAPPPTVSIFVAEARALPDRREHDATVIALNEVDVRARVRGFLIEQRFTEGQLVQAGDVLYRIDSSPYEIRLKQANAALARARATLSRAKHDSARARELFEQGVLSQAIVDRRESERDTAAAAVVSHEAAVAAAKLDRSYCTVYAPLSGRIGRSQVDVGNLVAEGGQDAVLARIVQVEPVHVLFVVSEQERLRVLRDAREWAQREGNLPVEVIRGDGSRYPHRGVLDFVAPTIDAMRGIITVRAVVPNPDADLKPGESVRVVTVWSEIPGAVVVPERAVQEEPGGSYVLLVAADDRVARRPVTLGESHDGMLHIVKGLAAGERVVVDAVHIARPGARVTPRESQQTGTPRGRSRFDGA